MAARPSLVDNLGDDASHAAALSYLVNDQEERHGLSVATGYVNLGGLHHLAVTVSDGREVRVLLGAEPEPGLGASVPMKRFELALHALCQDRDLARFPPSREAKQLLALEAWLERPHVQVRRYTDRFLHGKAYLFGDQGDARAALVTSANLTAAGLFHNLELGLVQYEPLVAQAALGWFDTLWNQAVDYKDDLQALLFPDVGLLSPRDIYLRALLELLDDDPFDEDAVAAPSDLELASFQRDGFQRALAILQRHHGVIYADGVGTGKTEIGLALIEEYVGRQGFHALVVCPAQLVKHWQDRLHQARLSAQVISYHALASDEQLAPPQSANTKRHLPMHKDAYRLVVMDEGHALRTPDTTWYKAAAKLLGGSEKHLALLTATPINNGLWDLFHLVMVFAHHDRAFEQHGIRSLRGLFVQAGANERNPENLNPDVLFGLTDMVSVRRDRQFIERHYQNETFPDGTEVRFPTPQLSTRRYDLDQAYPGLVDTITNQISALTMARYRPSAYRLDATESSRERVLSALLQSAVLKRFESCWHACRLTVERMITAHRAFLKAWDDEQMVPSRQALIDASTAELDETGLADWLKETADDEDSEPAANYRHEYRRDVSADLGRLVQAADALGALSDRDDPKLGLLRRLLRDVPSRKVIVFSSFVDTVRYLHEHLPAEVDGRSRVTVIGAETNPDERTKMLARLCPETVIGPGYVPPDGEVDMLLSNDVLSEGQNLQQAGAVISYDMPWNPQRVVQRYGRVVRLKSPHRSVSLVTMLPTEGALEKILQLELAIQRKIVAAKPYGMEIEVLSDDAEVDIRSYAQRLADADASLLDESTGSPDSQLHNGELLRAELRRALSEGELRHVRDLPWGVGAAFAQGPDVPSKGPAGVFFACRLKGTGRPYWRYVTNDGEITSTIPTILARIEPGWAPAIENPTIDLEAAWAAAAESIVEEHNEEADGSASDRNLGPLQRWARDVLNDPDVAWSQQIGTAAEALATERGGQVRSAIGQIKREVAGGSINKSQAALQIVEVVNQYGLRAAPPPEPLSPITEDDIGVVCWMGVLAVS